MKKLFCSALAITILANLFAQSAADLKLLFLRNHITIGSEIPFLIAEYGEHNGIGKLHLRTLPGFAIKVGYTYNFNAYFGITSGSEMGVQVFGFDAEAEADDFDLPHDLSRKYFQMIPFFSLPLLLTPRILVSERSILEANLGASAIFFAPGNTVSSLNTKDGADTKLVFEMSTRLADSPQFTFHAGLAYGFVLKSHNVLKTGLLYNFGLKKAIQGNYSFHKDDVVVGNGNVLSSFNYFAIELCYVFTRTSLLSRN